MNAKSNGFGELRRMEVLGMHDYLEETAALRSALTECGTDIAQSFMETGSLPLELWPIEHLRITLVSIDKRIQAALALLGKADGN